MVPGHLHSLLLLGRLARLRGGAHDDGLGGDSEHGAGGEVVTEAGAGAGMGRFDADSGQLYPT